MTHPETPFWNVNVPRHEHRESCPSFLEYALHNDKDRTILNTPDEQYVRQSWQVVQDIVRHGRLHDFQRVPSELRRYREYCEHITRKYGSIMTFVMQERLRWADLTEAEGRLGNAANYKILYNDWPYGIDRNIVHLVVWAKIDLSSGNAASGQSTDDLTPELRDEIQAFVDRTFVPTCGHSRVLWFKNWSSLKSVHAVEHFHVMLLEPPSDFVETVTACDKPLSNSLANVQDA